jgi:ubiquinone/menaquinone biosynthesis C-methylase UbiE
MGYVEIGRMQRDTDYFDTENMQFRRTLEHYLEGLGHEEKESPVVLDVACGKCMEAEVLIDIFGDSLIGIDSDQESIDNVTKRVGPNAGHFILGDVKHLQGLLDQDVDIVIARHPSIYGEKWKRIYKQCYRVTKPGGLLISTFYSNGDHSGAEPLVKRAGYKVIFSEENPFGIRYTDTPSISTGADRFIIVGSKEQVPKKGPMFRMLAGWKGR